MAKTREIKRRIKAVANIRRITKTMQMIATARFQAALKRATASKPYSRKIAELVAELAGAAATGSVQHPLLQSPSPAVGRELLLVITSNRGLCGGYNSNILRAASNYLKQAAGVTVDIEVVGKKGLNFFKFSNIPVSQSLTQFGDKPAYEEVEALAQRYMDDFAGRKYDAVRVCYMAFQSVARQSPAVVRLLPMENPAAEGSKAQASAASSTEATSYDFSPQPAELLGELLPETVKIQLFQFFNEAVVGEQVARMVAMKSATDAAGKMGKTLTRKYNRARQAAITTELSEIISGAAALK